MSGKCNRKDYTGPPSYARDFRTLITRCKNLNNLLHEWESLEDCPGTTCESNWLFHCKIRTHKRWRESNGGRRKHVANNWSEESRHGGWRDMASRWAQSEYVHETVPASSWCSCGHNEDQGWEWRFNDICSQRQKLQSSTPALQRDPRPMGVMIVH